MKRLLGLCALAALIASPALAADLYTKAPPPPPPVLGWTGFYVGLNGGYGWGHDPVTFAPATAAANVFFTAGAVQGAVNTNPKGGVFGAQLGYNWQWARGWVIGLETDIDWADIKGTGAVSATVPGFVTFTTTASQKLSSLGTFRGRIGWAPSNQLLLYGTGGLAYGHTQLATSVVGLAFGGCGPAGLCAVSSSSQWQTGWAAGVGAEWAFARAWSLRAEYLHYDLGSHTQNQNDPTSPAIVFASSASFHGDIVRGAINFRFGP